jgi:arylsulfatase A-like enzyme
VSLLPAFRGETPLRQKPLFWEWKEGRAVRDGEWKLVKKRKQDPWDLYHIANDPTETTNLASEYPDKVKEMEEQFMKWKSEVTSGPT